MEPKMLLKQILYSEEPKSIICCGEQACILADAWHRDYPETRVTRISAGEATAVFPLDQVYDVALISETLEQLSHAQGRSLLGQLRNSGARRIAVMTETRAPWRFADFIGLGFKRILDSAGQPPASIYAYDLDNYNHKRQWNNAENWANPGRWNKSRW